MYDQITVKSVIIFVLTLFYRETRVHVKLAHHNCIMQSLPGTSFMDLSSKIPVGIQEATILQSGKEVS